MITSILKERLWLAALIVLFSSCKKGGVEEHEFVKVQGGTFIMGDAYGDTDETPHKVTLSTFYISTKEVSVGQYRQYMKATGKNLPWKYFHEPKDDEPLRKVNYGQAVEYCKWISAKLGKKVVLPTEAQWEYAARGGQKTSGLRFAKGATTTGGGRLHTPGDSEPNELGLYDMSENVWEWCRDYYGPYSKEDQVNPTGPKEGSFNVIRGGSYYVEDMPYSRVADRNSYMTWYDQHDVGFRLAIETDEPAKEGTPIKVSEDTKMMRQMPYDGVEYFEQTKAERTKWFKEAKIGMFIHWGLYSAGGGFFKGKKYTQHYAEWIQAWSKATTSEYAKELAPKFTAENYDPKKWAKMAKHIGATYAVLTSKHHDGFTLFRTKEKYAQAANNPYGVNVNISPEGRDLFGEYADAFRGEGIRVGVYYSLIDWQHPDAPFHYDLNPTKRSDNTPTYIDYYKSHVNDIMSNYGKIDYLWSDYSVASKQGRTWDTKGLLEMIAKKQPQIVVSNRFWNGIENPYGDCVTPEKYVPATGFGDKAWEVCHTMNESFGYSEHDKHWKSPEQLFKILADINSKGGNLLLNVGPDATGVIPAEATDILEKFGDYVQKYKSSLMGTTASKFMKLSFEGKSNTVAEGKKTRLNFFVYKPTKGNTITLKGLQNKIKKVYATASKKALKYKKKGDEITIQLPKKKTDNFGWVVSVDVQGEAKVAGV